MSTRKSRRATAHSQPPADTPTPPRHRFGSHLSIAGGVHHAIEAALDLRLDTVQVFVKNQRQWDAPPLDADAVAAWKLRLATPGFGPPIAHATYLINLASADNTRWRQSCAAFADELDRCAQLAIPYLVVHPGAAVGQQRDAAIRRVARALDTILDPLPADAPMPLLETTAGQGTTLGASFEELGAILAEMRHAARVGVCGDTCHLFAAGYDLRHPDEYERLIAAAERCVGLRRFRCWHVNDSRGELGSRIDRHAHIGHGRIGPRGFRPLLADPRFLTTPMILETEKGTNAAGREWDRVNLGRLRGIERSLQACGFSRSAICSANLERGRT